MKKTALAILTLIFVSLFAACSADTVSGQYNGSGVVHEDTFIGNSSDDGASEESAE